MKDSIGIIGRGMSIQKIDKISNKFDQYIIINNFSEEIKVLKKYIKNKKGIHIVNNNLNSLGSKSQYEYLNIKTVIGSSFSGVGKKSKNHWKTIKKYNLGMSFITLPHELRNIAQDHEFKIFNTGLISIYYSVMILNKKNIWICGIDFYHCEYYSKKALDIYSSKGRHKTDDLKTRIPFHFIKLVKAYPKVNFHLATMADRKLFPKLNNLHLV